MRTGFINRPGVTYDELQLDRFYAEDIQAIADFINDPPVSGGDVVGPDGCDANAMAFFNNDTGKSIGASTIYMPIPGDLYSEGTLTFVGGLISDYAIIGKQISVTGATSADLEGIMLFSNVTPGKRVAELQSFESGAGEFYSLSCLNRGYTGSAYVLLDDTAKKGGLVISGTADNSLFRVYSFDANSTTAIQRLALTHGGFLGLGVASPTGIIHTSISGASSTFWQDCYDDNTTGSTFLGRKSRGTLASPTAALVGDTLSGLQGRGMQSNGAFSSVNNATILFIAAENFTSTANGTYITFSVTPNTTTSRVERMRIDHNGNVGIGTTPNANALLDVASTTKAVLLPRMTTTQRDAISSPVEGMIIYNTTTHVFNFRNASAWAAI